MAITNTVATIPGIVVPIFVGFLTHDNVSIFNILLSLVISFHVFYWLWHGQCKHFAIFYSLLVFFNELSILHLRFVMIK